MLKVKIRKKSRFVVIGLGGVGCMLIEPLSIFLSSLQTRFDLVLVDGDQFEPSNLTRMKFHEFGNKADVKATEIDSILGEHSLLGVSTYQHYVLRRNIKNVILPGDTVFMCVDNHPTRKLVSDHCRKLEDVVLISGGNDGVDEEAGTQGTYGNAQVYIRRSGKDVTVGLDDYHPEIKKPRGKMPGGPKDCMEAIFGGTPQILFANMSVASAMLNAFYAVATNELNYQEVKFDIIEGRSNPQLKTKRKVGYGKK